MCLQHVSKQRGEQVFGLQERHTFLFNFNVIIQHEFSTQMMLMTTVDKPKTQTPYSVRGTKQKRRGYRHGKNSSRDIHILYIYIYIYIYIHRKAERIALVIR